MASRVPPLPLVLLVLCSIPLLAQPVPAPPAASPAAQSEQVRSGVRHFERAFYELTPHKHDVEAAREFDLAVADFERELAARPGSAEAHRYLGRIWMLRSAFGKAAAHYDALLALNPGDIDAYALSAAAYAEAGDRATARARLVAAQERTDDPRARARLAEYLARLEAETP